MVREEVEKETNVEKKSDKTIYLYLNHHSNPKDMNNSVLYMRKLFAKLLLISGKKNNVPSR